MLNNKIIRVFPRNDKDWFVGEQVQVVLKPRSRNREKLGLAVIINKEVRCRAIDDNEAKADGFNDCREMEAFMVKAHGIAKTRQPMNKITLRKVPNFV